MENEEGRVLYLIEKLRSITLGVQVMPFAFCALYILAMVLYLFVPENVCGVLDTLFYVSPTTVVGMLICSRILKLCKWHRRACALPLAPQIAVFVDYHIIDLSRVGALLSISISAVMAILLLIICQHISAEDGIDPYSEEFAYLGGDIAREVSDIVCELSCPKCHKK